MTENTIFYPLAVILCRYKEYEGSIPAAPVEHFEQLFAKSGTGGVADYWRDVSNGRVNLDGSQVFGWYYLPHTRAEEKDWIKNQILQGKSNTSFRAWRIQNALELAAANGVKLENFYGVVAIYEYPGETGGVGLGPMPVSVNGKSYNLSLTILDQPEQKDASQPPYPFGWKNPAVAAHEVGHALGFEHSFRYLGPTNPSHMMYGDRWDIMSADVDIYKFTGPFGLSGPGLNAAYLYSRGWFGPGEVWEPANGSGQVTLAPLHPAKPGGVRAARIPGVSHLVPINGAGDFGWPLYPAPGYYIVEYRSGGGWDAGMEAEAFAPYADDVVLVHWGSSLPGWKDRSVLLPNADKKTGLRAGDSFIDDQANLRIDVVQIDQDKSAMVEIGPAPSVILSREVLTESSQVISQDVYEWPGVPGYCYPKKFKVSILEQKQAATVTVNTFGLRSPVTLMMSIGKASLNGSSGTLNLEVSTYLPDIGAGSFEPYKKVKKFVELTYTRQGNAIEIRNRPEDGNFVIGLTVKAIDAFGVEASATVAVPFSSLALDFEEDFQKHAFGCLMAAIFDHLKEITKTIPVERGDEPSPVARLVDPSEMVWVSRAALTSSARHLRLAASAVYGPLFEELAEPAAGIPWLALGRTPDRVEFQIPGGDR